MAAAATNPTKLECTIINPADPHPHTHTIIFLHGRGDNAKNFSRSLAFSKSSSHQTLFEHFPSVRWVFPSSELRKPARFANVEGAMMSQWFDTWDVGNLSYREELQMPGLAESVASILAIYDEELDKLGGDARKLILAGISQGGAVVMHTLLNLHTDHHASRLGGVMGFSCRFPFPGRSLSQTRKILDLWGEGDGEFEEKEGFIQNTPVLIQHCLDDPLVAVDTGRQVRDTMTRFGAQVTWKEYPEGGHWIRSPEGIDDAVAWLRQHAGIVIPVGES